MKKKTNVKSVNYALTFESDQLEPDIRWIICQHCKKPVYGMRTMKDAFLPNKMIVKKWEWKNPNWEADIVVNKKSKGKKQ